jgi:hypothetical protein
MQLPGNLYKAYDSNLGKLAKSSSGTLGDVLGDLRGVLREAMDRSIKPEDAARWATARKQYLNLQTVADAAKNQTGVIEDSLSPARLLQAVNAAQKNAKFGSGNDLAELAQFAKKTLPDKIPNSGTAQRLFYQKLLQPAWNVGSSRWTWLRRGSGRDRAGRSARRSFGLRRIARDAWPACVEGDGRTAQAARRRIAWARRRVPRPIA